MLCERGRGEVGCVPLTVREEFLVGIEAENSHGEGACRVRGALVDADFLQHARLGILLDLVDVELVQITRRHERSVSPATIRKLEDSRHC